MSRLRLDDRPPSRRPLVASDLPQAVLSRTPLVALRCHPIGKRWFGGVRYFASPCLVSTWMGKRSARLRRRGCLPRHSRLVRVASRAPARTGARDAVPEVSSTARRPSTHGSCGLGVITPPTCRWASVCFHDPDRCRQGRFVSGDRAPLQPDRRRPLTVGVRRLGSACPPDGPQTSGFPVSDGPQCLLRFLRSKRPRV